MSIPNDPVMLLSYMNTQLRDNYSSLDDLCDSMDLDCDEVTAKLSAIGYEYNPELNQFK